MLKTTKQQSNLFKHRLDDRLVRWREINLVALLKATSNLIQAGPILKKDRNLDLVLNILKNQKKRCPMRIKKLSIILKDCLNTNHPKKSNTIVGKVMNVGTQHYISGFTNIKVRHSGVMFVGHPSG